jgi:hypothetical protein
MIRLFIADTDPGSATLLEMLVFFTGGGGGAQKGGGGPADGCEVALQPDLLRRQRFRG